MILSLLFFIAPLTHAAEPALNYAELEAIAKVSINAEVDDLNRIVAAMFANDSHVNLSGYKKKNLKIFQKFNKPEGMDAEVIYNICLLTKDTVSAITSKKITRKNLQVTSNINAINSLRSSMSGKFFRVVEHACTNAKARFMTRLGTVTQNGTPLNLSEATIKNVADVVFFPTEYAKPGWDKTLVSAVPYVINGVLIVSRVTALAGVVIDSIWMSMTTITSSAFAIKRLLPGPDQIFKQRHICVVDGIRIDLDPQETQLLQAQ